MIDDFEYYVYKLKKPTVLPNRPVGLGDGLFWDGNTFGDNSDLKTRHTFAAVTTIKDGVLTVEWKVEGL